MLVRGFSNAVHLCAQDNTLRAWDMRPYAPANRCVKVFVGHSHTFEKNPLKCDWSPDGSKVGAHAVVPHVGPCVCPPNRACNCGCIWLPLKRALHSIPASASLSRCLGCPASCGESLAATCKHKAGVARTAHRVASAAAEA